MEHLQHFGLSRDPFSDDVSPGFYLGSRQHTDAGRRVLRGIQQGKGLTVLTGPVGSGKTVIVRRMLESLEDEVFEASLLVPVPDLEVPSQEPVRIDFANDGPYVLAEGVIRRMHLDGRDVTLAGANGASEEWTALTVQLTKPVFSQFRYHTLIYTLLLKIIPLYMVIDYSPDACPT